MTQSTDAGTAEPSVTPDDTAGPFTMTTVCRPDGSIVLQNAAARAGFKSAPDSGHGFGPAARHFVDPADGAARLARAAAGESSRGEADVHTAAGIRRVLVDLSPAAESPDPLVVISEEPLPPSPVEAARAEQSRILQVTLDNMEQGLLVLDEAMRVELWNRRFVELLGPPEKTGIGVGSSILDLVRVGSRRYGYAESDIEKFVANTELELKRRTVVVHEIVTLSERVVERRLRPVAGGGWIVVYLDITARKKVEQDLRRAKDEAELASRTKTEFLANMSHELRTPLNAIIGFSDILTSQIFGPLGDPRYVEYSGDIRDSGYHLLQLINDVLDVSKIEFGKVELTEETVDLPAIVESSLRLMRDRADAAGVKLSQFLAPLLPAIQADSRRLKQVLLNLLSNSVKFTPAGGRVVVRVEAGPEGCRIDVEDTGIGIAPDDLDEALRPFGQIDSRLARKYEGTGLGLPLSKALVELHGGKLELVSAPGKGTTATVWLPASRLVWPGAAGRESVGVEVADSSPLASES